MLSNDHQNVDRLVLGDFNGTPTRQQPILVPGVPGDLASLFVYLSSSRGHAAMDM